MTSDMIQFPLRGLLGEILLTIEWVIFFIYLELTLVFWHRVKKYKNEIKSLQEKGYILLFLGFSLMWLFFIISDYYVATLTLRLIFLNFGYIALMIGTLIFIYVIERYKNFTRKKYLFTIIFSINVVIYSLILTFSIKFTQIISSTFWPIFIVFFVFYSRDLHLIFKRNPILGKYKKEHLKLVLGIFLLILGFGLTTDFIINIFGLIPRLIGDLLQIIAILSLFWFFISIPSFTEYEWKDKIDDIFIIHKSGLLIYQRSFKVKDKSLYDSYISGLITSLKMMLETVSENQNISFIERKRKTIIIQTGKYIYGALICNEKLKSLLLLLNNFIRKIEFIYSNILQEWDGNLKIFELIDKIADKYFI